MSDMVGYVNNYIRIIGIMDMRISSKFEYSVFISIKCSVFISCYGARDCAIVGENG